MFGKDKFRDVYLIRTKGWLRGDLLIDTLSRLHPNVTCPNPFRERHTTCHLQHLLWLVNPPPLTYPHRKPTPTRFTSNTWVPFTEIVDDLLGTWGEKKNWGEAKDAQNVLPGFICPDVRSYYLKKNACIVAGMSLPRGFWDKRLSTSELRIPDPSRRQYGSRTCNFWRVFFLRSRVWKFLQTADE